MATAPQPRLPWKQLPSFPLPGLKETFKMLPLQSVVGSLEFKKKKKIRIKKDVGSLNFFSLI
jgi:hypothetical protein